MSDLAVIVASGGTDAFITLTDAAKSARDNALQSAREIKAVTSQMSRAIASEALSEIHGLLSAGEACRKSVKKPFLAAGDIIDEKAKEFSSGLAEEKERLRRIIADFDNAEAKKAAEEARKLREAAALAEQERIKALQDARRAETEAQRAEQLKRAEALQEQAKAAQAAVVAPPPKPAGASTRRVWKGRCTDAVALYKARPDLVDLVPSQSRINAAVSGGLRECAGLHIYEDSQISTRS